MTLRYRNLRMVRLVLAVLSISAITLRPARAADENPPPAADAAPVFKRTFIIHGYLTQAYARTTGGEIWGATKEGTTDYGRAALQLRFEMSPKDTALIQLRHVALGASPTAQYKPDVEVNWAYFEHRFSDALRIRVGRAPLPYAFDNDLHSVGVVLPFYRLPISVYPPDTFNHETLDGANLTYDRNLVGDWGTSVDLYAGDVSEATELFPPLPLTHVKHRDLRGGRVLIHPTDDSLQFYFSQMQYVSLNSALTGFAPADATIRSEGARGRFGKFDVQAEHTLWAVRGDKGSWFAHSRYVQVGYAFTDKWSAHVLMERLRFHFPGAHENGDEYDGTSASISYRCSPNVVLKLERTHYKGFITDVPVRNIFTDRPYATNFAIASVSVAF